jgi:hypothetical protein
LNTKKPLLGVKETTAEQPVSNGTTRPKNPSANLLPKEGYILEIDGKFKTEYETSEQAMKAGLELKTKYPHIQVMVYGAKERTRTLVELPAKAAATV